MIKDTRRFEWEEFLAAVTGYYAAKGCEIDMKFQMDGEGFARFVIRDNASGESRAVRTSDALQELKDIFFPSEVVKIISIYKPRHGWFGQEYIYLAFEREDVPAG